jgi:hypothetical protein
MTRTAEQTEAPRWILGSSPGRDLVVPADVDAPPAVRAASDAFATALKHYGEVGRTALDARRALKLAPLDDAAALALRRAEQEAEGARVTTRAAAVELANAVHQARPGWLVDAEAKAQTIANTAGNLLVRLAGVLDQLAAARDIVAALESFPDQGSLVTQRWVSADRTRGAEQRAAAIETLRRDAALGGNMSGLVERSPLMLLAALQIEIEG